MLLDHYVSAMDSWKGRIDSETDYDAFRWHQWVQPIDLNDGSAPFTGKLGFAFIGFCSDKGVARNKGRTGTALAPDFVRGQMSGLPCTFSQEVKLYDAGDIICDEISLEEGQRELGCAVEEILRRNLFPIVLGGGHETTFGHFQGQHNFLKDKGKTPELGIVNFDAHFDLRPYDMGNSSGTMFRQMADVCKAEGTPYHYFPIGIQHIETYDITRKNIRCKLKTALGQFHRTGKADCHRRFSYPGNIFDQNMPFGKNRRQNHLNLLVFSSNNFSYFI